MTSMRPFEVPKCGLSRRLLTRLPVIGNCCERGCALERFDTGVAASLSGQGVARRAVEPVNQRVTSVGANPACALGCDGRTCVQNRLCGGHRHAVAEVAQGASRVSAATGFGRCFKVRPQSFAVARSRSVMLLGRCCLLGGHRCGRSHDRAHRHAHLHFARGPAAQRQKRQQDPQNEGAKTHEARDDVLRRFSIGSALFDGVAQRRRVPRLRRINRQ